MIRNVVGFVLACVAMPAAAETPRFSNLFSDHAVLQRDEPVRIWGEAAPGAELTLKVGPQTLKTKADPNGRWQAVTTPLPAGGPYTLSISDGTATTSLNDIMMGEVWFCSGQSNMGYKLENATNATNEIRDVENNALRFIDIGRDTATSPRAEAKATSGWKVVSPSTAGPASAVCYYMAKNLQKRFKVPVGFITSTWGGTQTQAWIGAEGLRPLKIYDQALDTLAIYARDAKAGETRQAQYLDAWWTAREPNAREKAGWAGADYDDTSWKTADAGKTWERGDDPALAKFNGAVWYRTTITLTEAQASRAVKLALGLIDDSETTFINGIRIGATEGRTTRRTYDLPQGVLKAGRNVIAIRVLDSGGSGGLYDSDDKRYIALSDGSRTPLPSTWRYKISADLETLGAVPVTPWEATKGTGSLYNAMVAPVTSYTVKGVAWYQGESNVYDPDVFGKLLPALITQWRSAFGKATLPFLIVQLPNYGPVAEAPRASKSAEVREHQRLVALSLPSVGLTPIIDVGDRYDIHPGQKSIVGHRLALTARRVAYGEPVPQSPAPESVSRSGPDLVITFADAASGLRTLSSDNTIGFEVCDATRACRFAAASAKGNTVTLAGANQAEVRFIRYAWAESPIVNLFNSEDLPVTPFEIGVP